MGSPFDNERFISVMKKYPKLHDESLERSGYVAFKYWTEIGYEMHSDWNMMTIKEKRSKRRSMRRMWEGFKNSYFEYLKNLRKQPLSKRMRKQCPYFNQLRFLPSLKDKVTPPKDLPSDNDFIEVVYSRIQSTCDNAPRNLLPPEHIGQSSEPCELLPTENFIQSAATIELLLPEQSPATIELLNLENCEQSLETSELLNPMSKTSTKRSHQEMMCNSNASIDGSSESAALSMAEDCYGHRAFLLSYLPAMNSLPSNLAMAARAEITGVFERVMERWCYDFTSDGLEYDM